MDIRQLLPIGSVVLLKRRKEKGQRVYYLAGASDWGVEENGASMLEAVRITAEWNKKSGTEGGFAGIVFDVEPYLLEEWDDNQESCMEQYAANCIQAYQSAREEKLAVIICIPNFYDRIGLSALLEKIIEEGCDGIAVMNYNKKNEAGQIEEELRLAEKYGKNKYVWDNSVDDYILLKSNEEYFNDPVCKNGYFRGVETYNFVKEVMSRGEVYKKKSKTDSHSFIISGGL